MHQSSLCKTLFFTTACALLLPAGSPAQAQALDAQKNGALTVDHLYVSPQGNDSWSGQSAAAEDGSGPFQTLAHAQDAVAALAVPSFARPVEVEVEPSVCPAQDFLSRWFPAAPAGPVVWHADPSRTVLIYTPTMAQQNDALAAEDFADASGEHITRFYVSASGNDSWRGCAPVADRDNGPFRTLAHAQETVNALLADNPKQPVEIVFESEAAVTVSVASTVSSKSGTPAGASKHPAGASAHLTFGRGYHPGGTDTRRSPIGKAPSASPKLVFAHYMLCNRDYGGSVAGYERDIQDAKAAGLDGFALNCGSWDGGMYKGDAASMFQAVRAVAPDGSFKLFFSADMTGMTGSEILEMMTAYSSHPNYWHLMKGGVSRPVLSTWGGEGGTFSDTKTWWNNTMLAPLRAAGINPYFMPFFFTKSQDGRQYADLTQPNITAEINGVLSGLADGMFYAPAILCPLDPKNNPFSGMEIYAASLKDAGLGTMGSVAPQYWGSRQTSLGRRYVEYSGGEGLTAQWNSIINVQKPNWVECFTWNDFDEATYFSPIDDVNKYWPWTVHSRLGFYKCHAGAAKLNQYYINWYKTGMRPFQTSDSLYCFYRTHPKNAVATNDPVGPVYWFIGDCTDTIFVTTILTAPATLVVTSGSQTSTIAVPAGLHNTRVPFNVGAQSFQIVRGGQTVVTQTGEPVVASPLEYDFNYYTAAASSK